jgi:hypothetical protein
LLQRHSDGTHHRATASQTAAIAPLLLTAIAGPAHMLRLRSDRRLTAFAGDSYTHAAAIECAIPQQRSDLALPAIVVVLFLRPTSRHLLHGKGINEITAN